MILRPVDRVSDWISRIDRNQLWKAAAPEAIRNPAATAATTADKGALLIDFLFINRLHGCAGTGTMPPDWYRVGVVVTFNVGFLARRSARILQRGRPFFPAALSP
jgi:hypothetical protein